MGSREDRILSLAATLKSSGLAKSEVQARMMAEEMIGVEENVQKRYEEEHVKAHEYLKTTKNLGTPRYKESQEQKNESKPKIEPIGTKLNIMPENVSEVQNQPKVETPKNVLLAEESAYQKNVDLEDVHTDINFGKGTLKDLMMSQIKEDRHEIKNIEELAPQTSPVSEDVVVEQDVVKPEVLGAQTTENDLPEENVGHIDQVDESVGTAVESDVMESNAIESDNIESVEENEVQEHALDGKKLQEMMEEDGPLEEHTREIKEKPKDVKPKEEYAENSVDLSQMFNVHK